MTVSHTLQMLLMLEKCITRSHITLETVPKFETLECPMSSQLYACFCFVFYFIFLFSVPDCWCLLPGHRCPSINYEHSSANVQAVASADGRMAHVLFFLSYWDGAPSGSWCPTKTAYSAYRERRYYLEDIFLKPSYKWRWC